MRKATRPLGSIDSLNPCSWRGEQLHHHGGDVRCVVLRLCVVVKLIICKKVPEHNRKVRLMVITFRCN
jgi:hypothetical protein